MAKLGYTPFHVIGKGTFGEIWTVLGQNRQKSVLKVFLIPSQKEQLRQRVLREIAVLKHLNTLHHPNIMRLLSGNEDNVWLEADTEPPLFLAAEFISGTSLAAYIRQKKQVPLLCWP